LLISLGAEINPRSNVGTTPLMDCIGARHKEIITLLLDAGANPNVTDEGGDTPLSIAAEKSRAEIVKQLLKAGADPNLVDGEYRFPPLYIAAQHNDCETAKVLIAGGADVNLGDKSGISPLHGAIECRAHQVAKLLLAAGAKPDTNADSLSPRELAEDLGDSVMLEILNAAQPTK
jgi:uncharacterized protein